MYRSILVPLDGSAFSEPAISYAAEIARRSGGRIHLAHVLSGTDVQMLSYLPPGGNWEAEAWEEQKEYLDGLAERVRQLTGVAVSTHLGRGLIANTLKEIADEVAVDLVVMTTHGRSGFNRAWLGSVADRLVRTVEKPLLLVRPGVQAAEATELDLSWRPQLRRILVPLDGSKLSEQVLLPALALGQEDDAEYTLLRVLLFPHLVRQYVPATYMTRMVDEERELRRDQEFEAGAYLQKVAGDLDDGRRDIRTRVLSAAEVAPGILKEADEVGADLIAVATHGRGSVGRAVLGSVADKVIRGSTKPVLIYRPTEG